MLRSPAEPTAITAVSKLRHAVERDDVSFRSLLATAPSGRPKVATISLSLSRLGWRKAPGDVWATKLRPICDFVKTWVEESSWKCWSDWPVNSTEWEGCDGHNSASARQSDFVWQQSGELCGSWRCFIARQQLTRYWICASNQAACLELRK